MAATEERAPETVPAEAEAETTVEVTANAAPTFLRQATTSAASILASARAKASELLHQGPMRTSQEGQDANAKAPGSAVSPATGTVEETHRSAAQVASSLMEAAAGLTRKTRDNTSAAYAAAVQGLQKLTAPTRRVAAVCKADLRTKPCPQVLLLCCNWVATQGLHCNTLFQPWANASQVQTLADRLEDSLVLLPADLDPALASAVILHFLSSLEEPLLTHKLAARWLGAGSTLGQGTAQPVSAVLADLPLANWSSLKVLMEMCYRVASQFNVTGMNAVGLAKALAPVLLWHDHAPGSATGITQRTSQVAHITDMAAAGFQALKSKLVSGAAPSDAPGSTGAAGEGDKAEDPAATEAATQEVSPPPSKPHVVLDEDEELLVGDAGAFLDKSVSQQESAGAAAGAGAAPAATSPASGSKYLLQGEELQAAVAVVEYLILNYDELFVNV